MAKWYHDTVPTIDFETLVVRLDKLYQQVNTRCRDMRRKEGKKRLTVVLYKNLVDDKNKTYDIFEEDKLKRKEKEEEWGVSMGKMEEVYLADMREERKMECGGSVDNVWYQAVMKKRRQKEKEEKNREEMALKFQFKPIEELFNEEGDLKSSEDSVALEKSDDENNIIPSDLQDEMMVEEDIVDKTKKKKSV